MLKTSRRNFLKSTAVAGAGVILMHNLASGESPNEKINFAAIGVSGKGGNSAVTIMEEVLDGNELFR